MDSLQNHQPLDARPDEDETKALASVHLTRFTIHPERRRELIDAARSHVSSSGEGPSESDWELLVELEDGDWLQISVTNSRQSVNESSAYLDLTESILGDEDGWLVCSVGPDRGQPFQQVTQESLDSEP